LVQHIALALYQFAATHRGRRISIAARQYDQRPVGYQFGNGWRIQLDVLNLLNSSSYNASYAYGALLPSDALFAKCFPASGAPTVPAAVCQNDFMDYSIHPLDSLAVRLTLAGPIDTINIPRMAAEFERALPTYKPPSPNYDWTGFYVGAYVDTAG
jgi:hypothetical protein